MYKSITELNKITQNEELWGGKACYLFFLEKNGFNVPNAVILSSKYYEDYIGGIDNSEQLNEEIQNIIESRFNAQQIIFRSSANIENSDDMSSAGVFESFIYETGNEPYLYLERVWNSSLDENALGYYNLIGLAKKEVKMAVIIQQYISGQFAAVVQSFDVVNELPIMMIEYASGATTEIVNGTIDADFISVDRDNRIIEKNKDFPFAMSIIIELNDSIKRLENLLESHIEVEIQISNNVIYFLQVRKLI